MKNHANQSTGRYPYYHALWHLHQIGVLDLENFTSDAWNNAAHSEHKPIVALLDNSVANSHPNLKDAISHNLAIDFFSAPQGAFHYRPKKENEKDKLQVDTPLGKEEIKNATATLALAKESGERTSSLCDHLLKRLQKPDPTQSEIQPTSGEKFSSHGTAMAGLIGGRPSKFTPAKPSFVGPISNHAMSAVTDSAMYLPYAGVNPYCQVVPVSTSFHPDPDQLIHSLLYASFIGADVIVLAKDFYNPKRNPLSGDITRNSDSTDIDLVTSISRSDLGNQALWDELETLIISLSKQIPILCAAGNGGDNKLIYPASLATPDNGIIPIGARSANGEVAAYSSLTGSGIYAPSGDGERLDKEIQRLDTFSPEFEKDLHSKSYVDKLGNYDLKTDSPNYYSQLSLITTDVPGDFGYNGSEFVQDDTDDKVADFGSYYCEFSGTSGAVAIAAGFLSLAYSNGFLTSENSSNGLAAKSFLTTASTPTNKTENYIIDWSRVSNP